MQHQKSNPEIMTMHRLLTVPIEKKSTRPTSSGSFQDMLEQIANQPIIEEEPVKDDEAPQSPDPRCHHRSKLITGISKDIKENEEELEKERQRLRKLYLNNRAETVLYESKYGEIIPINYNEFC